MGVQSWAITELVRSLPSGVLRLETDEEGNTMTVTQGRRIFKLPTSTATWFQEFSKFPEGEVVVWNGESFSDIIEKVLFCVSDDEETAFGSLLVKPDGQGGVQFAGLDGSRFASCVILNDELLARLPEDGIKIPKKHVVDLKKLLGDDDIELMITEKRLFVRDKEHRESLSVPLASVSFVDCSGFMARATQPDASVLNVDKDELLKALSRIFIFNTKDEVTVYMTLREDSITLESSDKTTGSAQETIQASNQTTVPFIAFMTKGVMEILQHLPSSSVTVRVPSADGPCLFQSADEPRYGIVTMPMQVVTKSYYEQEDL